MDASEREGGGEQNTKRGERQSEEEKVRGQAEKVFVKVLVRGRMQFSSQPKEEAGWHFHFYFRGERHLLEINQVAKLQVFSNRSAMLSVGYQTWGVYTGCGPYASLWCLTLTVY